MKKYNSYSFMILNLFCFSYFSFLEISFSGLKSAWILLENLVTLQVSTGLFNAGPTACIRVTTSASSRTTSHTPLYSTTTTVIIITTITNILLGHLHLLKKNKNPIWLLKKIRQKVQFPIFLFNHFPTSKSSKWIALEPYYKPLSILRGVREVRT